jgi:hypothetical protein
MSDKVVKAIEAREKRTAAAAKKEARATAKPAEGKGGAEGKS